MIFCQQMFWDRGLSRSSERLQSGDQAQQKDPSLVFKQSCMSSEVKEPAQGHRGLLSGLKLYTICVYLRLSTH